MFSASFDHVPKISMNDFANPIYTGEDEPPPLPQIEKDVNKLSTPPLKEAVS